MNEQIYNERAGGIDKRQERILVWLNDELHLNPNQIAPASSDASFRRYFRVHTEEGCYIVMDAPPEQEDVCQFVTVARLFATTGICVPIIHQANVLEGFLLLSDLGKTSFLELLDENTVDILYPNALEALFQLQKNIDINQCALPYYDEALLRQEMSLFGKWFLSGLLDIKVSATVSAQLGEIENLLVASALEQPQVCVHRDFHSRNLMVMDKDEPGILDFQDAVIGPVTYDLVSLLRDCYISWPESRVTGWISDFHSRLIQQHVIEDTNIETFCRWFDLMGLQRHLKAIGIFSRLKLRDHKPGYLKDIPRTLGYVVEVSRRYPELRDLLNLLQSEVLDKLNNHLKLLG